MWPLLAPRKAPVVRPSRLLFFCLVGAFLLTILPHVQQLPVWVSAAVVIAMVIRSIGEVCRWPLPSPAFCGVMALCLLIATYLQFGTIFGREAGTAFMSALLAIKFYELRGPRDIALIIFCSFFVVMSSLLYSQALELFVYCLIMMWVLTALLLRTSMGDLPQSRLLSLLRLSGLIFVQALPLAIFLFFFFPRYQGVLELGLGDSSMGLTDRMDPGSISRLAEDDSTAMTVRFTGRIVPASEGLYWRALVLWRYADGAWTPGEGAYPSGSSRSGGIAGLPKAAPGSDPIEQEITIWPHFHRWLFALDYPVTLAEPVEGGVPDWSEAWNGGVISLGEGTRLLDRQERYLVASASRLAPQELKANVKEIALQLPDQPGDRIDSRVRALADRLHEGCADEPAYVRSVLHYFRRNGFIYSDAPGRRGPDELADFLLHNKIGFCEHYASAFAVLMRLEHVPARVVVGYAGAQYNPYKNIYVVKQSNAHSWDEVWVEKEKEWQRVDPTAVLSGQQNSPGLAGPGRSVDGESLSIEVAHHRVTLLSGPALPQWMRQALLEAQLRRQEVEADWDDWVFSYSPDSQNRLAQALGFGANAFYVFGAACVVAVVVTGLIFAGTILRRPRPSPVENFYAQFCRRLDRRGLPRAGWEGPMAYGERAAQAFPQDRNAIVRAAEIVAATRYGPAPPAVGSAELKHLLALLSASRAATTKHDGP